MDSSPITRRRALGLARAAGRATGPGDGGDKVLCCTNGTITGLSRTGTILDTISIPLGGESEGLAVAGNRVFAGCTKPNRV